MFGGAKGKDCGVLGLTIEATAATTSTVYVSYGATQKQPRDMTDLRRVINIKVSMNKADEIIIWYLTSILLLRNSAAVLRDKAWAHC